MAQEILLKVAEAIQEDVNKGIVRIDSNFMRDIDVRPGNIVQIEGQRSTVAIADRALPGDIGLNIIRMDGFSRRNAKTSIGEGVKIRKAEIKEAKKVTIAPASQGVMIRANPSIFKQGLLGRAVVKGDLVSLGGTRRRKSALSESPLFDEMFSILDDTLVGFGLGDLKFIVADCAPKQAVLITENTEVVFNPEAVELKEEKAIDISYEDIGGLEDEIKKVREMVELPLKHPELFEQLGIDPPKGVLLHGPPGTGKTLLAKAVANETNANFYLINGPEIMSKYYGQSEENLRRKFEEAEKNAPSIIFIDEIDAIASKREETHGEVEKRVVAQLLALMDGLKSRGKVIVIAATNIPNHLDPALRRPGRFDREMDIGVPSAEGRLNILKIHTRNMPLLGSLYLKHLKRRAKDAFDHSVQDIEEQIKRKEQDIPTIEEEIRKLEDEMLQLEEKKKKNDRSLVQMIADQISGVSVKIKRKKQLILDEKEKIKKLQSDLLEMQDLHEKVLSQRKEFNKVVNEIKLVEDARAEYKPDDPRLQILENNRSDVYKKLEDLHIPKKIIDEARNDGLSEDLSRLASTTHGFVGADLASLTKEAAMTLLRRVYPDLKLNEEEAVPPEMLERLRICLSDFKEALKVVSPSAMREVMVEIPDVKWTDVGGVEDVKQELIEAVEWPLKYPDAFGRLGVRPPRGVLLYGAPGTGKTLLAKAVANESSANFIYVKGPELLSKWVGESEKAVRKVFEKARQTAPTVIFFDEIDSIAPRRGSFDGGSHVTETVVNQLLTEMDGLESMQDVVIIAATNRPDILDTALLRPGRFDRVILVPIPDKTAREEIFKVHTRGMPLAKDVNLKKLIEKSEGYVGADVEAIVREAAILALRDDINAKEINHDNFMNALDKVFASVTKDVEKEYEELKKEFSSAKGKEILLEKPNYMG